MNNFINKTYRKKIYSLKRRLLAFMLAILMIAQTFPQSAYAVANEEHKTILREGSSTIVDGKDIVKKREYDTEYIENSSGNEEETEIEKVEEDNNIRSDKDEEDFTEKNEHDIENNNLIKNVKSKFIKDEDGNPQTIIWTYTIEGDEDFIVKNEYITNRDFGLDSPVIDGDIEDTTKDKNIQIKREEKESKYRIVETEIETPILEKEEKYDLYIITQINQKGEEKGERSLTRYTIDEDGNLQKEKPVQGKYTNENRNIIWSKIHINESEEIESHIIDFTMDASQVEDGELELYYFEPTEKGYKEFYPKGERESEYIRSRENSKSEEEIQEEDLNYNTQRRVYLREGEIVVARLKTKIVDFEKEHEIQGASLEIKNKKISSDENSMKPSSEEQESELKSSHLEEERMFRSASYRKGNLDSQTLKSLYPKQNEPDEKIEYIENNKENDIKESYRNPKKDGFNNKLYNYRGNYNTEDVNIAGVNKYLEPLEEKGEYEVHLKVLGETLKSIDKLGVVVVYDNSTSMEKKDFGSYGEARYKIAKRVTTEFVRSLLSGENGEVKIALVPFNYNIMKGNLCDFTDDADKIISNIPESPSKSGTNTGAGLWKAKELFGEHEGEFDKMVIVTVTDGEPNQYPRIIRKDGGIVTEVNLDKVEERGAYNNTILIADSIKNLHPEIAMYSIGVKMRSPNSKRARTINIGKRGKNKGKKKDKHKDKHKNKENKDNESSSTRLLKAICTDPQNNYFLADDENEFISALKKIQKSLELRTIKNATITDPMGEFVVNSAPRDWDIIGYERIDESNYWQESDKIVENVHIDFKDDKYIITNINLGKNEMFEFVYEVKLNENKSDFEKGKFYETNKRTTLKPNGDIDTLWDFPIPSVALQGRNAVELFKVNEKSEALKGVKFELKKDGFLYKKLESKEEGRISVQDLESGKYELYETKTYSDEYIKPKKPVSTFKVDTDGNITGLNSNKIINRKKRKGKFKLKKVDEKGSFISGAEFTLIGPNHKSRTIIADKDEIEVDDLEPGTYALSEIKAPDGYIKTDTTWEIKVKEDGFTQVSETSANSVSFRSAFPYNYWGYYPSDRESNRNKPFNMDKLYPQNAVPTPAIVYKKNSINNRINEFYNNPDSKEYYYYKGEFEGKPVDVAGINKYLIPTATPGEYEVTLKVKGNKVTKNINTKTGIVIVYDNSGSMGITPDKWGKNRFDVAKNATKSFLNSVLDVNDENTKVALVTFGGDLFDGAYHDYNSHHYNKDYYDDYSCFKFTNDVNKIVQKMPKKANTRSGTMGTYTAKGLKKATELFRGENFDKKIIIMVTDGIPTHSPKINSYNGLDYSDRLGRGGNYYLNGYSGKNHGTATVMQAEEARKAGITLYSLGILIAAEKNATEDDAHGVMVKVAGSQDRYFNAKKVDDLAKNFEKVQEQIGQDTISKATVIDPMSENVNWDGNYKVKKIKNGYEDPYISSGLNITTGNNRKLKLENLTLGEGESIEVKYKIHLNVEDINFPVGEYCKTNGVTTIKPNKDSNTIWTFPQPEAKVNFKIYDFNKKWQSQGDENKPLDAIEFRLQKRLIPNTSWEETGKSINVKPLEDKSHTFENLLPFNNSGQSYEYRVVEGKLPDGYEAIEEKGGDGSTIINREIPVITVVNQPNKVEFIKQNNEGKTLSNAEFKLLKDGNLIGKYEKIITKQDGKIILEKLPQGEYKLYETKAPDGYITPDSNNEVASFVVDNDGNITDVTPDDQIITNDYSKVNLKILKYENASNIEPLAGAQFQLYKNEIKPNYNKPSELITIGDDNIWTTNEEGIAEINGLENGTYWLKEITPPKGYKLSKEFIGPIKVQNGQVTYTSSTSEKEISIEIENTKNEIKFIKVDGVNINTTLKKAKFKLMKDNKDFGEEKEVDGNGEVIWEKLEPGNYQVYETLAPKGYVLQGYVANFTVDNDGKISSITDAKGQNKVLADINIDDIIPSAKVKNFKAEYPHTGGNGMLTFIGIGFALMGYAVIEYKRKDNMKNLWRDRF